MSRKAKVMSFRPSWGVRALFVFALASIACSAGFAQSRLTEPGADESAARLRPDIEVDPMPYFLHGYSVHGGLGEGHWRMEGEAFRADVPEWIRGNKDFDVSYAAGGFKTQYFLSPLQKGTFVGTRVEFMRESITSKTTGAGARPFRHDLGIDAGYRFHLGQHLYLTPWGGLDYVWDAHDVRISQETFKESPLGFFATVHVGYRF
jgi:hypothetical protein